MVFIFHTDGNKVKEKKSSRVCIARRTHRLAIVMLFSDTMRHSRGTSQSKDFSDIDNSALLACEA